MTDASRRATIRTRHDHPDVIAAAIVPDNTDQMSTHTETCADSGGVVVTTIARESTGSLRTTVDDYLSNLTVAQRITDTTIRS